MWSAELLTSIRMKVTERHLMKDGTMSVNRDATVKTAKKMKAILSPVRQRSRHETCDFFSGSFESQRKQTVSSVRMVAWQLGHFVILSISSASQMSVTGNYLHHHRVFPSVLSRVLGDSTRPGVKFLLDCAERSDVP